ALRGPGRRRARPAAERRHGPVHRRPGGPLRRVETRAGRRNQPGRQRSHSGRRGASTQPNDRRETLMADVDILIRRIDQELGAEVQRQKADWADIERVTRERGLRLERYEAVAKHVIDLLKPRLAAFLERFKDVAKAAPSVREHTRAVNL